MGEIANPYHGVFRHGRQNSRSCSLPKRKNAFCFCCGREAVKNAPVLRRCGLNSSLHCVERLPSVHAHQRATYTSKCISPINWHSEYSGSGGATSTMGAKRQAWQRQRLFLVLLKRSLSLGQDAEEAQEHCAVLPPLFPRCCVFVSCVSFSFPPTSPASPRPRRVSPNCGVNNHIDVDIIWFSGDVVNWFVPCSCGVHGTWCGKLECY